MFWHKKEKEVRNISDEKKDQEALKRPKLRKHAEVQGVYDKDNYQPLIRASICNGEQVAGFCERRTGKFTDIMLIRNQKDLDRFLKEYGVEAGEIRKEY